jgi:hypothetical protein
MGATTYETDGSKSPCSPNRSLVIVVIHTPQMLQHRRSEMAAARQLPYIDCGGAPSGGCRLLALFGHCDWVGISSDKWRKADFVCEAGWAAEGMNCSAQHCSSNTIKRHQDALSAQNIRLV